MEAMKIESFDSRNVTSVLKDCEEALQAVADRYGLRIERKHCSYHSTEIPVAFKLTVPETTEDGRELDAGERDFRRCAPSLGLKPDDYGKTFTSGTRTFTICGVKPRASKYPILGKGPQGGVYKFELETVLRGLGRDAA